MRHLGILILAILFTGETRAEEFAPYVTSDSAQNEIRGHRRAPEDTNTLQYTERVDGVPRGMRSPKDDDLGKLDPTYLYEMARRKTLESAEALKTAGQSMGGQNGAGRMEMQNTISMMNGGPAVYDKTTIDQVRREGSDEINDANELKSRSQVTEQGRLQLLQNDGAAYQVNSGSQTAEIDGHAPAAAEEPALDARGRNFSYNAENDIVTALNRAGSVMSPKLEAALRQTEQQLRSKQSLSGEFATDAPQILQQVQSLHPEVAREAAVLAGDLANSSQVRAIQVATPPTATNAVLSSTIEQDIKPGEFRSSPAAIAEATLTHPGSTLSESERQEFGILPPRVRSNIFVVASQKFKENLRR